MLDGSFPLYLAIFALSAATPLRSPEVSARCPASRLSTQDDTPPSLSRLRAESLGTGQRWTTLPASRPPSIATKAAAWTVWTAWTAHSLKEINGRENVGGRRSAGVGHGRPVESGEERERDFRCGQGADMAVCGSLTTEALGEN